MLLLLGLLSWLVIGLVAGLAASAMLPGEPPLGWAPAVLFGLGGAITGGLLATALGFGGLAAFDVRALATATLVSVVALLTLRYAQLRD